MKIWRCLHYVNILRRFSQPRPPSFHFILIFFKQHFIEKVCVGVSMSWCLKQTLVNKPLWLDVGSHMASLNSLESFSSVPIVLQSYAKIWMWPWLYDLNLHHQSIKSAHWPQNRHHYGQALWTSWPYDYCPSQDLEDLILLNHPLDGTTTAQTTFFRSCFRLS